MIKKLMTFLLLLAAFIATPLFVSGATEAPAQRATVENVSQDKFLPRMFVKGSEVKKYEYDDIEIYDFRDYFEIFQGRQYILKMDTFVDGYPAPTDLGGYVWDFGNFDVDTLGTYTIKLSYTGTDNFTASDEVKIQVIAADTVAPVVYRVSEGQEVNFDLGQSFDKFIKTISAVDNVDGLLELTLENFTGYDTIPTGELNSVHNIVLKVTDKAGNSTTVNFSIKLVDSSAPVIYGAVNVETKKNKVVDYKAAIYAEDNHTSKEDIVITYSYQFESATGEEPTDVNGIDFATVGTYVVKVSAKDLSGLTSSTSYRVIVKDSITLFELVLFINLGVLVIAGIAIGTAFLIKRNKIEGEKVEK